MLFVLLMIVCGLFVLCLDVVVDFGTRVFRRIGATTNVWFV